MCLLQERSLLEGRDGRWQAVKKYLVGRFIDLVLLLLCFRYEITPSHPEAWNRVGIPSTHIYSVSGKIAKYVSSSRQQPKARVHGLGLDFSSPFSLPCAPLCSAQTSQTFQWPWVCSTVYRTKQTGQWNPSCHLLLCSLKQSTWNLSFPM